MRANSRSGEESEQIGSRTVEHPRPLSQSLLISFEAAVSLVKVERTPWKFPRCLDSWWVERNVVK